MKDYAKRPTSPRRKKTALTLFIITLAIALPALMFVVKYQKTIKKKTPTRSIPIRIDKKNTAQKFDFYTLLPKRSS